MAFFFGGMLCCVAIPASSLFILDNSGVDAGRYIFVSHTSANEHARFVAARCPAVWWWLEA